MLPGRAVPSVPLVRMTTAAARRGATSSTRCRAPRRRGPWLAGALALATLALPACRTAALGETEPVPAADMDALTLGAVAEPGPRDLDAYTGLGTWVDVFDFVPRYAGDPPPLSGASADEMADRGVRTVFVQATRWDDQSPDGIVDRAGLRSFLVNAHRRGLRVVGWYLPHLGDVDRDLERVRQILDFEASGHRFDGIGIDIEWTEAVPDDGERNERLVQLSARIDELAGDVPVAAIVLPAVQIEVVNPRYWPAFPYRRLAPYYDVWMPMAYWTFRDDPYGDGGLFVTESVDRLRNNLGDPDALVAPIGGIGDLVTEQDVTLFAEGLAEVGAIGGSYYDWATLSPERRAQIEASFADGAAADLPAPELRPGPGRRALGSRSGSSSQASRTASSPDRSRRASASPQRSLAVVVMSSSRSCSGWPPIRASRLNAPSSSQAVAPAYTASESIAAGQVRR